MLALILAAVIFVSCGATSGVGRSGDYNGKLNLQTDDVSASREEARVIVEQGHGGRLENETTDLPPKLFGFFPQNGATVLTFRVPAAQFDSTMVDLDSEAVGTLLERKVRGRDDIEQRSDLSEVAQVLDERLAGALEGEDPDEQAINAQETLAELTEEANFPVVVVNLHPGRGLVGWLLWLLVNPLLAVLVGFGIGFAWFHRKEDTKRQQEDGTSSPVIGAVEVDRRQNSPEKNPGVQDRGETT